MSGPLDPVELAGPWQHRRVAANGARFHVAETGPAGGPLVLLLHGFPEFWWAWRDQLPALGEAGYRAVAMDLRGYAGSDKTPNGYDPITLGQDVSGVVKALGARRATLVGHGWGGYVGWACAAAHPQEVAALCAVSAPHPRVMLSSLHRRVRTRGRGDGGRGGGTALRHVLAMQVPWRPERRLADASSGFLAGHLRSWSAAGSDFPDAAELATYQAAIAQWPASHCALEYHRWLARSRLRTDGRTFDRLVRPPITQPVACIRGSRDPVLPAGATARSAAQVDGAFSDLLVDGAGHFPHEEAPEVFTGLLLDWLAGLRRSRRC